MSKITGSFLILVFVIVFSSIVYIWKSDSEKRNLETQITEQQKQIANLESQMQQLPVTTTFSESTSGTVLGETTKTGIISGKISFNDLDTNPNIATIEAIIVCAAQTHTSQEICSDFVLENNQNELDYSLEIPKGTYEIYVLTPPLETKTYYSDLRVCNESDDCSSNSQSKRLIQVLPEEKQQNIDILL